MANTGQRREAFGAYYFVVEIEGERFAHFRSASGLKSEGEVVPLMEGGWNAAEHKLVGRTKYPNIILKQGSAGPEMWRKRQRFISDTTGDLRRFDGAIIQMGPGGRPVATWTFTNGWVCKWEAPDWDAGKNEIAIETIEIAHEGLALNGSGPTPPRSKHSSGAKSAASSSGRTGASVR
ncbi:MAG TPA: phage tail protein [Pseudomonadota bacterium]|nr:phage tail protein [Pseudomonadota bacterium]